MSADTAWALTANATIWPYLGSDHEGGTGPRYGEPIVIDCDYGGDSWREPGVIGVEIIVKNRFWTEYPLARQGDLINIGVSVSLIPTRDATEITQIIRYADTFDRLSDDFVLLTGIE